MLTSKYHQSQLSPYRILNLKYKTKAVLNLHKAAPNDKFCLEFFGFKSNKILLYLKARMLFD